MAGVALSALLKGDPAQGMAERSGYLSSASVAGHDRRGAFGTTDRDPAQGMAERSDYLSSVAGHGRRGNSGTDEGAVRRVWRSPEAIRRRSQGMAGVAISAFLGGCARGVAEPCGYQSSVADHGMRGRWGSAQLSLAEPCGSQSSVAGHGRRGNFGTLGGSCARYAGALWLCVVGPMAGVAFSALLGGLAQCVAELSGYPSSVPGHCRRGTFGTLGGLCARMAELSGDPLSVAGHDRRGAFGTIERDPAQCMAERSDYLPSVAGHGRRGNFVIVEGAVCRVWRSPEAIRRRSQGSVALSARLGGPAQGMPEPCGYPSSVPGHGRSGNFGTLDGALLHAL